MTLTTGVKLVLFGFIIGVIAGGALAVCIDSIRKY